jgi:hypothetical protein
MFSTTLHQTFIVHKRKYATYKFSVPSLLGGYLEEKIAFRLYFYFFLIKYPFKATETFKNKKILRGSLSIFCFYQSNLLPFLR